MDVREPHYRIGHWLAVCDRCGVTKWNDGLRLEWTGLRVCDKCLDPRHPQEFLQGVKDDQAPDWVRPKPAPVYIGLTWLTADTTRASADSTVYKADLARTNQVTADDL